MVVKPGLLLLNRDKLQMSQNKFLRKIFGTKENEGTEQFRILQVEQQQY